MPFMDGHQLQRVGPGSQGTAKLLKTVGFHGDAEVGVNDRVSHVIYPDPLKQDPPAGQAVFLLRASLQEIWQRPASR